MADDYTYQDKLTFKETIMFHLRVMSKEGATDGWDKEYEDLVDQLGIYCWAYFSEDEKAQWNEIDNHRPSLMDYNNPDQIGRDQRKRIIGKMRMAMIKLDDMKILLTKVRSFGVDLDLPEEVRG